MYFLEPINSVVDTDKTTLQQFDTEFGGVTYMPDNMLQK